MYTCGECGKELNTNNSHNWRCENKDCDAYHLGDRDIHTRGGGYAAKICPNCAEEMYWTRRTSHWECDECGYGNQNDEQPVCDCGCVAAWKCPNSSCLKCCPGCERHEKEAEEDDHDAQNCKCGRKAAIDCEYGECGTCCTGCSRHGENTENDDDEDEGWVPDCNSCEDDEDVTGPDEDDDYYCSYCEHYIDDDGDCIDDDCDCDEDEEEDDYHYDDEIILDIQLENNVERILLPKINTQLWIIADRKKMKSIDGDIEQIDIILRPTAINNNGILLISAMNLPSELTSIDVDSVERMRKSVGAEFSFILFDPKMSVTQNVFDRIQQYPMRAIHLKEPLHDSLLNLIKSGIGL